MFFIIFFFFFKQKTAYEMRISDWSSDVCSSDLLWHPHRRGRDCRGAHGRSGTAGLMFWYFVKLLILLPLVGGMAFGALWLWRKYQPGMIGGQQNRAVKLIDAVPMGTFGTLAVVEFEGRSEEHTSELQSLMRISYAV